MNKGEVMNRDVDEKAALAPLNKILTLFLGTLVFFSLSILAPTDDALACAQDVQVKDAGDADSSSSTPVSTDQDDALSEVLAGHSYHGDAFNEGSRQSAYIMGGTGKVIFPVTTSKPEAQTYVDQGVGQLHGFWVLEAERSFRQAATIDPDCAMAYWGAALATYEDAERSRGFIAKAVELLKKHKEKYTPREKSYIESVDRLMKDKGNEKDRSMRYVKDLEDISIDHPTDVEAKALIVHRIWYHSRKGIPVESYLAPESLLKEIFRESPLHPAHHYRIHLWDRRKPELALESAAMCGLSAPKIAHMWHMPGHIYSRLKRYEDAVFQQEASARVDHAHMIRDRVMPDEINNFAHNNEWLIRNLAFLGRVDDAIGLSKNMMQLPRHPKYNSLDGDKTGSAKYGRRRLLQLLREFQLHHEAVSLYEQGYFEAVKVKDKIPALRLAGCAAASIEDSKLRDKVVAELDGLLCKAADDVVMNGDQEAETRSLLDDSAEQPPKPVEFLAKRKELGSKELKKQLNEISKKFADAKRLKADIEKATLAIEGYQAVAENDFALAVKRLRKAAGEDVSWLGELELMAGKTSEGIKKIKKQVDRRKNESIPLARLAYAHYLNGDMDKALVTFQTLREATQSADLNVPLFARLSPIAKAAELGENWMKKATEMKDIGFRPPLDTLGPFRWSPPAAPEWELYDSDNNLASSDMYKGKNYLLIFYLGHGCLHCAEQLQAFNPRVKDFEDAGIEMIAISSDDNAGLSKSLDDYKGEMPMRLASDSKLKVFKAFRAHDDFESQALHGTFLIDANGKIRWQDISYEPFMDHEFLLGESKRILKLSEENKTADESKGNNSGIRVSRK